MTKENTGFVNRFDFEGEVVTLPKEENGKIWITVEGADIDGNQVTQKFIISPDIVRNLGEIEKYDRLIIAAHCEQKKRKTKPKDEYYWHRYDDNLKRKYKMKVTEEEFKELKNKGFEVEYFPCGDKIFKDSIFVIDSCYYA